MRNGETMQRIIPTFVAAVIAILVLSPMVYAQTDEGQQTGGDSRRQMMMQKLSEACSGKAANDACSVTRPNGESVKGTCETVQDRLLCRPSRQMMMQKLSEACSGKAANDACSVTRPNGESVKGTCETMHDQLLCRPAGMAHHGGMGMGGDGGMSGAPDEGAPPDK